MDWTIIIISVLGGAAGASSITAFVNWRIKIREEKHEQNKWLRDIKFQTYLDALTTFRKFPNSLPNEENQAIDKDYVASIHNSLTRVHLIAPERIRLQAQVASSSVRKEDYTNIIWKLSDAMAEDLQQTKKSEKRLRR